MDRAAAAGRHLVLVEGRWSEAGRAGVPYVAGAETLSGTTASLPGTWPLPSGPLVDQVRIELLSDNPALLGGAVSGERYALIART